MLPRVWTGGKRLSRCVLFFRRALRIGGASVIGGMEERCGNDFFGACVPYDGTI